MKSVIASTATWIVDGLSQVILPKEPLKSPLCLPKPGFLLGAEVGGQASRHTRLGFQRLLVKAGPSPSPWVEPFGADRAEMTRFAGAAQGRLEPGSGLSRV
jgi:hypothetical protein